MSEIPANLPKTLDEALRRGFTHLSGEAHAFALTAPLTRLADCSAGNPHQICAYGACENRRRTIYYCDDTGGCTIAVEGPC